MLPANFFNLLNTRVIEDKMILSQDTLGTQPSLHELFGN